MKKKRILNMIASQQVFLVNCLGRRRTFCKILKYVTGILPGVYGNEVSRYGVWIFEIKELFYFELMDTRSWPIPRHREALPSHLYPQPIPASSLPLSLPSPDNRSFPRPRSAQHLPRTRAMSSSSQHHFCPWSRP